MEHNSLKQNRMNIGLGVAIGVGVGLALNSAPLGIALGLIFAFALSGDRANETQTENGKQSLDQTC